MTQILEIVGWIFLAVLIAVIVLGFIDYFIFGRKK